MIEVAPPKEARELRNAFEEEALHQARERAAPSPLRGHSSYSYVACRRVTRPSSGRSGSAQTTRRSRTWRVLKPAALRCGVTHDTAGVCLQVAVAHLRPLQAPRSRMDCARTPSLTAAPA